MYGQIFELHAQLLKALAHPRRLEIIHLLRKKDLCVSEIYEMLDLPQANISQHLMILRDSGVLKARRDGKQVCYSLTDPNIIKACDYLREVLIKKHRGSELADQLSLNMMDLVPVVHDPVCQMRVSPKTAGYSATYHHQTYYFCASGCLKKFNESPAKYAN